MSAGFATLVARGARSTGVRQIVVESFDEIVDSFAADIVSYWKFQNSGVDEFAQEDAPFTGFPEANIETIVKFDTITEGAPANGTCIAWPGTENDYAQAAHDAAHKTSSGTIVLYFQRDSADQKSQLIEADANGSAGGMAIGLLPAPNGSPDAYIRGTNGTPVILNVGFGTVLLDNAYCLIFKWGPGTPGGMRLALWNAAGALVSFATDGATIGLSGASTIRFGATHNNTNFHNGPYGRVIWMNRRITDAEEAIFGALARTISRSAVSYRQTELGMSPLALWGLGDAFGPTLTDATAGARHGTYIGVVTHDAPDLPDNSADGAANFGATGSVAGTGSGSVPAAGLSLAIYSLSFWFMANHIPGEGETALPLVIKGNATAGVGDFSCYLPSNGGDLIRLRLRDTANNTVDISSTAGTISVSVRYHVCVRANSSGVELYLDGVFIGSAPTITAGWSNNTQPLTFAFSPNFADLGNCIIDEVCLIPRFITIAEVVTLAQKTGIAPVAVASPAIVPENATTVLDVLASDSYVGTPTLEKMADPGGGDIATVIPATGTTRAHFTYQAGNVAVDTVRSFDYRIVDPNGTSNTVTVSVTIQADDFVPVSIANCFQIPGAGSTVTVNSGIEMEAAVNAAGPGDHIVFPPGTYAGGTRNLDPQGTAANPIVIRPSTGKNNVTITNATWILAAGSNRLVIYGLNFSGGGTVVGGNTQRGCLDISGAHHRVTRCQFRQIASDHVNVKAATDTRIDHCDFADLVETSQNNSRCIFLHDTHSQNGSLNRVLIDYCYFHDIIKRFDSWSNVVHTGGGPATANVNRGIVVDNCLFERVSRVGSSEVVVVKHSGVTIRFCTFRNMANAVNPPGNGWPGQYVQQRQGAGLEMRSCWFENTGSNTPIRFMDDESLQSVGGIPLCIGNRIVGTGDIVAAGGSGEAGEVPGGQGFYNACCNGRFVGNRMGSGNIRIGVFTTGGGLQPWPTNPGRDAQDNHLQENTRDSGAPAHQLVNETGTTVAPPAALVNEPFVPAVELNPVQVGLGAPDPLCPNDPG